MTTTKTEIIDLDRRRLLGAAATGIAALGIANVFPGRSIASTDPEAIRPFRVNVPEADLDDLRYRLAHTRLPEKETVSDFSQGVPLKTIKQVLRHWQTGYDWRKVEARINSYPNFITGLDRRTAEDHWPSHRPDCPWGRCL